MSMKKVPTAPSLALKTLEIVSALKRLHSRNQEELNLLVTKTQDRSPFKQLI